MRSLHLALLCLIGCAQAQVYEFCSNGVSHARFENDSAREGPSIEVIAAQAPLFSTNPTIGQKAKYVSAFHTALVFAQHTNDTVQYWTLEFDFTGSSVITGVMPSINGSQLTWQNAARYCLTEGLLWGREHWTEAFEPVFRINAAQAQQTFSGFIGHVNSSDLNSGPQYQLWNIANTEGWWRDRPTKSLIGDVTCTDGVVWVLHYIAKTLGVFPRTGFVIRGTQVVVPASAVEPVDTRDDKVWADIVAYYTRLVGLKSNINIFWKLYYVWRLIPARYVYDTNSRTYYRVHGNSFPYMHIKNIERELTGPPTHVWEESAGLTVGAGQAPFVVQEEVDTAAAFVV